MRPPTQQSSSGAALRRYWIDIGPVAPLPSYTTGTCCRDEKRTRWKGMGCLRLIL